MSQKNLYPEGEDLKAHVARRNKRALQWQLIFMVSTVVGIVALTALLYNIINGAFGLVAIQNEINPARLVVQGQRSALLKAPNVTVSEDDFVLGEGVAANPYAIGFFGHAYYAANQDTLRTVAIDGVVPVGTPAPTLSTVLSGGPSRRERYPLTRPLYLYSSARLREPVEFQVGTNAIVVAVSQKNDFLQNVTKDELAQIFIQAEKWSDVNSAWPDQPIVRFTPTGDSRMLAVFADNVFVQALTEVPKTGLIAILENNLSAGLMRRFNNETALLERTQAELYKLVSQRVVKPTVSESWSLYDSIFSRDEIEQRVAEKYPGAVLKFRSWLTPDFIVNPQSSQPEWAGVRTAIFGSLWVVAMTILIAFPLGVGAAIYLEEYAGAVKNPLIRWINNIIQTNINNLAAVPSIIYGILGLAIFVRVMEPVTSGVLFGAVSDPTTANGRTVISAGATLALLILPIIIINAQEAIRAVPNSLRQASYGLGATRWQTIWNHVLPVALPGVLTGAILAISRAVGETAPLIVIGASTFITVDPDSPFSKFTVLPIQIYQWTSRPQAEFRNIAAAAIIVLLVLLLSLNASAVLLRNRYSKSL